MGILEPNRFSERTENFLKTFLEVRKYENESLGFFLKDLDILFIRLKYKIDQSLLRQAPNLKIICSPTTGLTHVDQKALERREIKLLSLKGERSFLNKITSTAEHTVGLVIACLRNYKVALQQIQDRQWERDLCFGTDLAGKTVGIIGLGRVGTQVAKILTCFGCQVLFYDLRDIRPRKAWEKTRNLPGLIKRSDIVVLTASFEKTGEIINSSMIELLSGKYFINTSRGELVDEDALVQSIKEGKLRGVGIDVVRDENDTGTLERWFDLAHLENVILTPHIAGASLSSLAACEQYLSEKLRKLVL